MNKNKNKPTELTLADSAEAWIKEQGLEVPERETVEWEVMYSKWIDFAFEGGPQIPNRTKILETIVQTCSQVGLSLTPEGLHEIEDGVLDELGLQALGLVIGEAVGISEGFSFKRVAERIYRVLENRE